MVKSALNLQRLPSDGLDDFNGCSCITLNMNAWIYGLQVIDSCVNGIRFGLRFTHGFFGDTKGITIGG